MRIYLVRHGESVTNHTRVFAGQTDVELTELGHRQAACVTEFFKDISIEAVYSSDLSRAMDTVRGVAEQHGLPLVPEKGLRELYAGQWEGCAFEELPERYPAEFEVWRNDIGNARPVGGESTAEAAKRADATLRRLAAQHLEGPLVAATHGGIIRGLLALWITGSVAAMRSMEWAPNASVTVVDFEDDEFRVVEPGIVTHLGELVTELPKTV